MKKAKDWARQLCSVIPHAQKRPVWNFQPDHFQLIGLLFDRFRGCHLKCWSCGSQDDPMVRTRHKRWVWMLPAWNIPGLLFTTGCNVMPGVLSNGSGCCLSQKFPVCYYGPNIDHDFISMENCSLETCAWTGRRTPIQLNKVTIVEDFFSLVRSETKVSNVILFLRIVFSFI